MDKVKTDVIFRVWKDYPGTVVAIMPGVPGTNDVNTCTTYEHVGQHGLGDIEGMMKMTRLAGLDELIALEKELTQRGYRVKRVLWATDQHREQRLRQIKKGQVNP